MPKKVKSKVPRCGTCGYPLRNNNGMRPVVVANNGRRRVKSVPCKDAKCLFKGER